MLILHRLISAGFMINIRKSTFLTSSLKLLGFVVGAGLRKPVFPQLEAWIESKRAPRTKSDIQGIYGLLSYFRDFVPSFALLAAPISRLLRKDGPLEWTARETAIVERVLTTLATHAGLKLPEPARPFTLDACATDLGYGGVLLQQDISGALQPVGFASTLKTRKTGSEAEATLAAVLYCLRKFSTILYAAPTITVRVPVAGLG